MKQNIPNSARDSAGQFCQSPSSFKTKVRQKLLDGSAASFGMGRLWHPRRDSNAGPWLRRPVLYPLSYGGLGFIVPQSTWLVNPGAYSGSMSTISPSTALLRPGVGGGGGGGGACAALGGSIIGGSMSACIIV